MLELLFYNNSELLEGPEYIKETNSLLFVSIKNHAIHIMSLDNGFVKTVKTDGTVGCATNLGNNKLISAEKNGIYKVNTETGEKILVCHPITDSRMRYNDGKLDPKGRLIVGTMGENERCPEECSVYSVEPDGSYKVLISGTTISNGLGWTKDGKKMFFIDTPTKNVCVYDYDCDSGEVSNKKVFVTITEEGAFPDGMCVDFDDNIWVAEWGGRKVCKYDIKTKEKICQIDLPVTNVSSCCVGGENNEYLFITTAKTPNNFEQLAGGLFRFKIR